MSVEGVTRSGEGSTEVVVCSAVGVGGGTMRGSLALVLTVTGAAALPVHKDGLLCCSKTSEGRRGSQNVWGIMGNFLVHRLSQERHVACPSLFPSNGSVRDTLLSLFLLYRRTC